MFDLKISSLSCAELNVDVFLIPNNNNIYYLYYMYIIIFLILPIIIRKDFKSWEDIKLSVIWISFLNFQKKIFFCLKPLILLLATNTVSYFPCNDRLTLPNPQVGLYHNFFQV